MDKITSEDELKHHYANNFNSASYLQRVENRGKSVEGNFFITCMAEIFSDPDFQGSTLLEIGSGPTVHNIVPACKQYSHIVLSDFVEESCEAIRKWLKKDETALDWSQVLRSAAIAQGYNKDPDAAIQEIEALIRKNVKAVVHCDVLADKIVSDEFNIPYDVVLTSLTLEAACKDYDAFKVVISKINHLVKLNGHLVMAGFLNGGFWECGGQKFPYIALSEEDINTALEEGGFGPVKWKILPNLGDYTYDFEAIYCLSCVKRNEVGDSNF